MKVTVKEEKPIPPPKTYLLEMNEDEALVLAQLFYTQFSGSSVTMTFLTPLLSANVPVKYNICPFNYNYDLMRPVKLTIGELANYIRNGGKD